MKTELHHQPNPRQLVGEGGFGVSPISSLTRTALTNPWWRKDAMADEVVKQAGVGEKSTKPKATPRFLIGSPRSRVWSAAARQDPPAASATITTHLGLGPGALRPPRSDSSSLDSFPASGLAFRDPSLTQRGGTVGDSETGPRPEWMTDGFSCILV